MAVKNDDKESHVSTRLSTLIRYLDDEEIYPSLLLTLHHFPQQFKKVRSVAHLGRVICATFFYKRRVVYAVYHAPEKRHLYVKLLKTYLEGSKSVMGMVVAFNRMKDHEILEEGRILEALKQIIRDVKVVPGSCINDHERSQVYSLYFEIERALHPEFSLDEIKRIQNALPDLLQRQI